MLSNGDMMQMLGDPLPFVYFFLTLLAQLSNETKVIYMYN